MFDQTSNVPVQSEMPSSPPIKLWTPGFITGVTFFLGFPTGIAIAVINWMRMKMNDKALMHLIIGGAVTFIFVIILMLTPGTVGRGLGLLFNFGALFYLQKQMKQDIENFKMSSNVVENASQIGGCLIGLGILVLFLVFAFGFAFVLAILGVPMPD